MFLFCVIIIDSKLIFFYCVVIVIEVLGGIILFISIEDLGDFIGKVVIVVV